MQETKQVLLIHNVNEQIFDLPLHNYILTFDDGLASQYKYIDRISSIPTEKIFFISTGIICDGQQSAEDVNSIDAHTKAAGGDYSHYMTVDQIKHLTKIPNTIIGGHGHKHIRFGDCSLYEKTRHLIEDTQQMVTWFKKHLNVTPPDFSYPYNDDINGLYKLILRKYNITNFYGRERILVETLLHSRC